MALFAAGREEVLNQKSINKRVIVMLRAMRRAGAHFQLHKGDWPRIVERWRLIKLRSVTVPVKNPPQDVSPVRWEMFTQVAKINVEAKTRLDPTANVSGEQTVHLPGVVLE